MKQLGAGSAGLTVLLGAITALTPTAMDIYLVSMPSLTEALQTDTTLVQLTVAIYILGNALGQIWFGSLSDRFGRRPVLLAGLAVFCVASIACAAAQSIQTLIAARFFQGIGICAGLVVGRAIVRDCYSRERAAQVLSLMGMITAIAPILAPIVGSQLHPWFGWRASFTFVAFYGSIVFAVVLLVLGETLAKPDTHAVRPARMLQNFSEMLSDRNFLGHALVICGVSGGLLSFLASSSFVFVRVFGFSEQYFGFLFGLVMIGNITGALFGNRFVMRLGVERMVSIGTVCAMVSGLAMAALALAGVTHLAAVIVPLMAFVFSFAIVLPQATAAAMAPFASRAGAASSLLGFLGLVFSATAGAVVGASFDGTQLPMAIGVATMGCFSFLAHRLVIRRAALDGAA
jgi:MFS transporter, DHA1 family, multidrug resistance protein